MHPRAYIFDLDGTLVDSLRDIADALNQALTDHGLSSASLERVRGWVGGGLRALCQRACEPASPDVIECVIASAEMHYREHVVVHTRLYPNIMQMLDLLKHRGAKLAVLSNKPHALTVEVVRQLNIAPFFADVRGPANELERKPAPDGALAILGRLGVPAQDAMMVGDSSIDIETARNASMNSVGVSWGFRPVGEILAAGADFLVHDPLEIVSLGRKKSD